MDQTYFNNAKFIGSYPSTEDVPVDQGSEIAFVDGLIAGSPAY